jgi:hypothetical protein
MKSSIERRWYDLKINQLIRINEWQSSKKKASAATSEFVQDSNLITNIFASKKLIEKAAHAATAHKIRAKNKIAKQSYDQCVNHKKTCWVEFISLKCAYYVEMRRRANLCEINSNEYVDMRQAMNERDKQLISTRNWRFENSVYTDLK